MDGYLREQVYLGLLAMSGGKRLETELDMLTSAVDRVIEVPPVVVVEKEEERG